MSLKYEEPLSLMPHNLSQILSGIEALSRERKNTKQLKKVPPYPPLTAGVLPPLPPSPPSLTVAVLSPP